MKVTAIRLADIRLIVDQLWAEAVAAFRKGEKWWLSAKLEKIAAQEQDERLERDPWFNDIAAYVERRTGGTWFTTGEVLEHLEMPVARRERNHEMRVAAVLRQLGCDRKKRWDPTINKSKWAFQAPKENDENSEIGGDFNDPFF